MTTPSCKDVWTLIQKVIELDNQLGQELSDEFTDFECSWTDHAEEHHTTKEETDALT